MYPSANQVSDNFFIVDIGNFIELFALSIQRAGAPIYFAAFLLLGNKWLWWSADNIQIQQKKAARKKPSLLKVFHKKQSSF